ncbi:MAG TPA: hypothetical protein PKJ08_08485 [Candidatus Cloacimonadota bacterium]|nr:hypothetical protein [Candidatus Cloacimonadota bacterium]HPM01215.1 hypothetical protein [Candidatus Cloacimonadota bacterium]
MKISFSMILYLKIGLISFNSLIYPVENADETSLISDLFMYRF